MKLSKKQIEVNGKKAQVVFDEDLFFIVVESVSTENASVPLLDEKGEQVTNEGENGVRIPVFSFEKKKFLKKGINPFHFNQNDLSDEEFKREIESYKNEASEIVDLNEFLKPSEL